MKQTRTKSRLIASTAAALAVTFAIANASADDGVIATRQAGFKRMGAAMKTLGTELKGDAPSKPAVLGAARSLAAAAQGQGKLFPAGSGPRPGVKTDALPAIWTDRANFDGQMAKLVVESGKLAAIANTGDMNAVRAQFKATGAVCGACHRQFRADT